MIIDPQSTNSVNIYKLLIGAVLPRPIAFVSTTSADGINNLAPFSFFTVASANPPVICFTPMINMEGRRRDTLINAETMKEFVVNIVSEKFAEQMNETSNDVPPEVDEFKLAGLTPIASDIVRPPRVKESPINMECKLLQIVEIGREVLSGSVVFGQVLRFHIDDALFDNFRIDHDQLRAIGRMAGNTYARTTDRFDLERPGPYIGTSSS
jgi:flavin reductase (DIM6/NTAB) family NADH-FMN oxidoreductase RutF